MAVGSAAVSDVLHPAELRFDVGGAPGVDALHGLDWGGDGPDVLFLHANGFCAGSYEPVVAALRGTLRCFALDLWGHGRTAGGPERHGDLGSGGWAGVVADLGEVSALARSEHPGLPVVIIGHSMGSFALQRYLLDHSSALDGAVLTGTTAIDVIAPGIDPAQEVDLSAFNAPFAPARTDYDWLSRDEAEVDAYVADPACGFGLDAGSVGGMLAGAEDFGNPVVLGRIRSDLPILLVSGDADPLAGGGPLVELVGTRYREAGVTDVTVELVPGARHEVFNETNRDEITTTVLAWLARVVDR